MTGTTKICADDRDLYEDLPFCRGQKSLPGMRPYMFLTRKSNITAFPTRADSTAKSLAEIAKLIGDFVMAADKKWKKIELLPDQQQITSEQIGTYGSYLFKTTATVVIPGTEEEVTGLISEINNDDMVVLIPQRNGKFRCLGNEMFTVKVKPSQDTGKGTEDTNATTITIEVEDEVPAPFYPGKIETTDGDISGADGKPVDAADAGDGA